MRQHLTPRNPADESGIPLREEFVIGNDWVCTGKDGIMDFDVCNVCGRGGVLGDCAHNAQNGLF
jgi:hypothetical protein